LKVVSESRNVGYLGANNFSLPGPLCSRVIGPMYATDDVRALRGRGHNNYNFRLDTFLKVSLNFKTIGRWQHSRPLHIKLPLHVYRRYRKIALHCSTGCTLSPFLHFFLLRLTFLKFVKFTQLEHRRITLSKI